MAKTDEAPEEQAAKAPEAPVEAPVEEAPVEAPAEAPAPAENLVEIDLRYEFTTNGVKQGPGTIKVTKEVADDLKRRQDRYDLIERSKHESFNVSVNLGSIDASGQNE